MSRGNKWIPIDKYLVSEFKYIRREFSLIEAMYSFTIDQDKGKKWSISGYAMLWNWSRNRVRKFIKNIQSETGHYRDRKRTESGHPIHFIDKALMGKPDRNRTETGQKPDTTVNPKPNKDIYSRIVTYLNAKTGKKFRSSSKKTQSLIDSRLNEKYTPEDFKTVIDNKVIDYKNGDFDFIYLRPETLFGPKFESYLNQSAKPINGSYDHTPKSQSQIDAEIKEALS